MSTFPDGKGIGFCPEREVEKAKSKTISWFSDLFVGSQQQAAVSLIPKLAETIFISLRDQLKVYHFSSNNDHRKARTLQILEL